MNLTTSYQYIGNSPDNGVVIATSKGYYSKLYLQVKVKSYNATTATIMARASIRNNWTKWASSGTTIKLTGENTYKFVNSGNGTWSGANSWSGSSSYIEVWSDEHEFDVSYGTFNLGLDLTATGQGLSASISQGSCTVISPTVKIIYNANGGTGAPATQEVDKNKTVTLSTGAPSRSASVAGSRTVTLNAAGGAISGPSTLTSECISTWAFNGWNTKSDGTGTDYSPGASFTTGTTNTTLYAKWTATSSVWQAVTLSGGFKVNHTLSGWTATQGKTTPDQGLTPGASYVPQSSGTLYAVWEQLNVSLRIAPELFDIFYPIGSYYETSNIAWTPQLAGWYGTWVEDTPGRFTIAQATESNPIQQNTSDYYGSLTTTDLEDRRFVVDTTYGEYMHQLVINEMPSHRHKFGDNQVSPAVWTNSGGFKVGSGSYTTLDLLAEAYVGGDQYHNNLPPCVTVRRWHRIA